LYKLRAIEGLDVRARVPLREYARFGIGGDAALFADAWSEAAFVEAFAIAKASGLRHAVLGGGSNLIVADEGFDGIVLRYRANRVGGDDGAVTAEAGAELQSAVDFTIEHGLAGLHTMTRIPGWVGGAIYGNVGAYGHSIMESVERVRFFDGTGVRWATNAECEFAYRESVFKRNKDWIVFEATFRLPAADRAELRRQAGEIQRIRDEKYPMAMKCAGSIFKNCIHAKLPEEAARAVPANVVREGKVPSAWFLEQVGAKGMRRGDIQVAHYHANLIYNDGNGRASDVCAIVDELKDRVARRFGFVLEEEVQYVGFADRG
jgi:UDP-N-acetylmuramate dehydrogenase